MDNKVVVVQESSFSSLITRIIQVIGLMSFLYIALEYFFPKFNFIKKILDNLIKSIMTKQSQTQAPISNIIEQKLFTDNKFNRIKIIGKKLFDISRLVGYDKNQKIVVERSAIKSTSSEPYTYTTEFEASDIVKIEIYPCIINDVKTCLGCSLDSCGIKRNINYHPPDPQPNQPYINYSACVSDRCSKKLETKCSKCLDDFQNMEIILQFEDKEILKYTITELDFIHELRVL